MGLFPSRKTQMVAAERALPGREKVKSVTALHLALVNTITPPSSARTERAVFELGCFWGEEQMVWSFPGVFTTATGYAGGLTANPTYQDGCGHRQYLEANPGGYCELGCAGLDCLVELPGVSAG